MYYPVQRFHPMMNLINTTNWGDINVRSDRGRELGSRGHNCLVTMHSAVQHIPLDFSVLQSAVSFLTLEAYY